MADSELVLKPLTLRPGGGSKNPFASFGKGAGFGMNKKDVDTTDGTQIKKKAPEEIIRYPRDFLIKFSEMYLKLPPELENSQLEIIIDLDDPDRQVQAEVKRRVAEEVAVEDRDWNVKKPLPSATEQATKGGASAAGATTASAAGGAGAAGGGVSGGTGGDDKGGATKAASQGPANGGPLVDHTKFAKAADKGLQAWAPATQATGTERALRQIRGIINKLTPEKFDRLLGQLVGLVTSLDVLQGTIRLLFESAIAQPTFVTVYAELCDRLSTELPEFPPPPGESRPISFKRVLLNTCQEEYEGIATVRQGLVGLQGEELGEAETRAKQQLLGVVRLIAELYKMKVLPEMIMNVCVSDLLGDEKNVPPEDNIEAVCEVLKLCGKQLDASSKSTSKVESYIKHLDTLSKDRSLQSRIRFLIRDVLELRRSGWVPRREAVQARKIDEIHAEAQAELGLLPGLPAGLPGLKADKAAEVELFPAFKGGESLGTTTNNGEHTEDGQFSALLGDWKAPEVVVRAPPAESATESSAGGVDAATQPPKSAGNLNEEERLACVKNMYAEFLTTHDVKEALTRAKELMQEGYGATLIETGVEKLLDTPKDKEQSMLCKLLVQLAKIGTVTPGEYLEGVGRWSTQLEDISLDVPFAAKVLGELAGIAADQEVATLEQFSAYANSEKIESAEPRRAMWAAALAMCKSLKGDAGLKAAAKGVDWKSVLASDPEFDGDLPSVEEFMKTVGL